MQELASELDISHQALSERLRRAYGTLVTEELDVQTDGAVDDADADVASGSSRLLRSH